jgi:hypothetical protein
MTRILHRPMFRIGGSAEGGITSGLRQGYEEAGAVGGDLRTAGFKTQSTGSTKSTFPTFPEIKLPKSTSGADFWLNLGTSILAQPGGRPILQTLGTAGKEPLARLQQQRAAEGQLKYQKALADRSFMLETWKAMNDDERLDMEKQARLAFENGDFESYEEALGEFIKAKIYSKSGYYRPEVQKRITEEKEAELERDEIKSIQAYFADDYYLDDTDAAKYRDFKDIVDGIKGIDIRRDESVFIDRGSWPAGSFTESMDDAGNIILHRDNVSDFEEGYAYIDLKTGQGYYRQGPKLMKIVVDEEVISNNIDKGEELPTGKDIEIDPFAD